MTDSPTNAPELSVSDLAGALKRTIEDSFGRVRLRGEISGYKGPVGSGHVYFSLKDANARIDAVIWRGVFSKLRFRPEEGMEVIATGKVTTFPGGSRYQIVIDQLEPAGVGALMALLEERRRKLTAEGLFDPARKQLIPYLPRVIGVVTSPTGAVIRDILHRLSDRFPCHVVVWPVRVQGETSAGEVAAAIRGFNALDAAGPIPRPDVLIVARGGGSLEDLWGYNEEIVVRAAAESDIPLISAVGHETDTTLIDHAADVRAPTPTAAAEMAVPVRADLLAQSRDLGARLTRGVTRRLERDRSDLRSAARALPGADTLLGPRLQRLDVAALKLGGALRGALERRQASLQKAARALQMQAPQARLARFGERLSGLDQRLKMAAQNRVNRARDRLAGAVPRLSPALRFAIRRSDETLAKMHERFLRAFGNYVTGQRREQDVRRQALARVAAQLPVAMQGRMEHQQRRLDQFGALLNTLGYRQVLARGYVVVRDATGVPVHNAATVAPGQRMELEFADGSVGVTEGALPPRTRAAKPEKPPKGGQGSLF